MAERPYKYWAFISYSHEDEGWGQWLHRRLETYRVPKRLVGQPLGDESVPDRLFPVFRDREELPSAHELGAVINRALADSRNLIVICSPRAAKSRWVNEEIRAFRALGRADRIFCLIVDGEPHAGDPARECFPPALREPGFEPIAADAREGKDGRDGGTLKLISGLIDVGLDELRQRDRQRRFWEVVQKTAVAVTVVAALAGSWQWFLRERAAREQQIAMEQLVEAGRLELLDGRQARAAVLLHEALRQGYDTVPLRFMLGQAMLPIDALSGVRVRHGGTTVRRALFSPDGKLFVLIVASPDGATVAQLYDAASGEPRGVLEQVPAHPRIVQFLGDGSRLLVSGFAQQSDPESRLSLTHHETGPSLAVWRLDRSEPLFVREGHAGRTGTPVSADGTVAVAATTGISILDAATGAQRRIVDRDRTFAALTYGADNRWWASADAGGKVELRAVRDDRVVRVLSGFEGQQVVGLAFAPDGKRLLALSRYGDVRIWDVERGALTVAFGADPAWISGLMFSADGRRLLTIGSEGFKVWSTARGVLAFDIRNATYRDASAVLSPDGDYLYVADDTSAIAEIWAVRSSTRLQTLDLHANSVSAVALDAAGGRLLLASKDGTAEIWRARIAPAVRLDIGTTAPNRVLWSESDRRLIVAGEEQGRGVVATLDAANGAVLATYEGHRAFVPAATLSADGTRLLTAGYDGIAAVWDTATRQARARLELGLPFRDAALSPDGARAVLLGASVQPESGANGFLIDANSGTVLTPLRGAAQLDAFAFSPDARLLLTTDAAGNAQLWRTADGTRVREFQAHTGPVHATVFDAAGGRVVTGGWDHAVRIWPTDGGPPVAELKDPAIGGISSVRFAPDGAVVAMGTGPGDAWLWNPARGALLPLKGHSSAVMSLSFLHGGEVLITTGHDGLIRAWDVGSGKALALIGALGGGVYSVDVSRDHGRIAAGSPVTRQGGVWSTALERRPLDEVAELLRCRVPWRIEEGKLVHPEGGLPACR